MIQELALTESRSLRDQYARVDVLDKVKGLSMLPDGIHVTTDMVASYYEVDIDAIESVVRRNREELAENGRRVLKGAELRAFDETVNLTVSSRRNSLAVFTRRAVLNVGQLLAESPIARAVRTYLLDVEEIAAPEVRGEAVERAAVSRARLGVLKAADGLLDTDWLKAKARVIVAQGLGEEPEIDPLDVPLYVPDYLRDKGLNATQINSVQSWFGRRVASLYEAEHGEKPGKRVTDLPNGSVRETTAWTKRDLPFFEEAWERWYAAQYTPQTALVLDGS